MFPSFLQISKGSHSHAHPWLHTPAAPMLAPYIDSHLSHYILIPWCVDLHLELRAFARFHTRTYTEEDPSQQANKHLYEVFIYLSDFAEGLAR